MGVRRLVTLLVSGHVSVADEWLSVESDPGLTELTAIPCGTKEVSQDRTT
jgi:hypothetical protein